MKCKSPWYWKVRRQDWGFFEYLHRGCWTNNIDCKTLSAAMKHVNKNLNQGIPVILEKWTLHPKTSPRWYYHPKGTYRCIDYYYYDPITKTKNDYHSNSSS